MDTEKNNGLRIENISIDTKSVKQLSFEEQILKLAQDIKVKRERNNAIELLNELEEMSKENEEIRLDEIEVGTIEVGKENFHKNKDSREERD